MKIELTKLNDVIILRSELHEDIRGSFKESFRLDKIEQTVKRKIYFCQDNLVESKKGVIRGLHYQMSPFSQSKLVSVIKGRVLDVIVDIRKGSPTFGKYIKTELSENNQKYIFIPRGFAHGYITLSESSIFHYKVDNYYEKKSERGIAFDDPKLGIDWILPKSEWIVSKKDNNHLLLEKATVFDFNFNLYD